MKLELKNMCILFFNIFNKYIFIIYLNNIFIINIKLQNNLYEIELENMCMLFFSNLIYLIYKYITKYHRILF